MKPASISAYSIRRCSTVGMGSVPVWYSLRTGPLYPIGTILAAGKALPLLTRLGKALAIRKHQSVAAQTSRNPRNQGARAAMTAPTVCPHCNTPTPDGVPYGPYCCVGCRAAHALVSAAGLDGFYRLRGDTRLSAVGDRSATPHPERLWLTQTFQQAEQRAGGSALVPLREDVQGRECAARGLRRART